MRFVEHAEHRGLGGELGELIRVDPTEVVGFLADGVISFAVRPEEVADVVMEVLRGIGAGRDGMDVDIEDPGAQNFEGIEAGFFPGFPQCDGDDVRIPVGVASELEPAVEFAMVGEEDEGGIPVDDPGGPGDVADGEGSLEAVRIRFDERGEAICGVGFFWSADAIVRELMQKAFAGHGRIGDGARVFRRFKGSRA